MGHRFIYELFNGSACDTMGSASFTSLFWFWYDRLCLMYDNIAAATSDTLQQNPTN